MAVLTNSKHDQFAQAVAKGLSAAAAYVSAGYSKAGASANGARLIANDRVRARIAELQAVLSAGTIALEISSRNVRVQALQDRWDRLRRVITVRAEYYPATEDPYDKAIPGGPPACCARCTSANTPTGPCTKSIPARWPNSSPTKNRPPRSWASGARSTK